MSCLPLRSRLRRAFPLVSLCAALVWCGCPREAPTHPGAGAADPARAAVAAKPGPGAGANGAPCTPLEKPVTGRISRDTRWCGTVHVEGNVLVAPEATLTIDPGTTVVFQSYRLDWQPELRRRLRVEGRLLAVGKPGALIRFTSSEAQPFNGDWTGLELHEADGSAIDYAVIEYAERGLVLTATRANLSHVVVRYNNWEGLAVLLGSKVRLDGGRVYGNGYNCIDVKTDSHLHLTGSYVANCGMVGVQVERSTLHMEENLLEGHREAIFINHDSSVTLLANRFSGLRDCAISCNGKSLVKLGSNVFEGIDEKEALSCEEATVKRLDVEIRAAEVLETGTDEGASTTLRYLPGNLEHDSYAYLLPRTSKTRKVLSSVGAGLGLTWSLAWDGRHLWTANLDGEVMRLDPRNGAVLSRFEVPADHAAGMTYFQDRLWINAYGDRAVLSLDPGDGQVLGRFETPDPRDGCRGLTSDGKSLYLLGWTRHVMYQLSAQGEVLGTTPAPCRVIGEGFSLCAAGGLAWDGEAFWAPSDRLLRFDRQGRVLGWIDAVSSWTWDLAWDGKALWTTERGNEAWNSFARIFRVEVLAPATD